jgi:MYXO-CTERM domain-containing protein
MRHHQAFSSWVALSLVALATLSVKAARADDSTCQTNTDCGKGWSCQVVGGGACAAPGCAPGESCDAAPPCEDFVIKSCVPATCATDSDCGDGMHCYQAPSACADVACPQGQVCPPVACDPGPKQCEPKYALPCTVDGNCGTGFTCAFGEVCTGGTAAADAGAPGPGTARGAGTAGSANFPPSTTTCAPASTGSCQLTPVTCKTNTDCQAGWSCADANVNYGCVETSGPPEQGAGGSGHSADGGTPTPSAGSASIGSGCPPRPAPMLLCTPPNYRYYDSNNNSNPQTGSPTSSESGGATSAGASVPTTPERGATNDASGTSSPTTSTSCSFSIPGGASNSGFALLALGLVGFIRRRRIGARG